MNTQRLRHLVTVLERVRDREQGFNLARWVSATEPARQGDKSNSCGTVACAFGWAALDPTFNAQGLVMRTQGRDPRQMTGVQFFEAVKAGDVYAGLAEPYFDGDTTGTAAQRFFGMTHAQMVWLFGGGQYPVGADNVTIDMVINRTRRLLANPALVPA